jgi:prepilin peptidase CpaA
MTVQVALAISVGGAAIIDDVMRRQISNWIPAVAFIGGVVCRSVDGGWSGAGSSLLGTVLGFVVFLAFYLLGGMGGGDVKLMAGFGAIVGAGHLFEAALWTAACGGLIAISVLSISAVRARLGHLRPADGSRKIQAIPYAPAIAVGAWLALVPKG